MKKQTVKEWVEEQLKDEVFLLEDIVNHGCSGGVSGLIYYNETTKFHDEYENEIWDMLEEDKNNFGHKHILETISSFNGAKNVGSLTQLKNLLAWYVVEETCRKMLDEKNNKKAA